MERKYPNLCSPITLGRMASRAAMHRTLQNGNRLWM